VTQQNAALVEQAAAASESMQEQAMKLAELVGAFRLIQGGQSQVRQPARAAAKAKTLGARPAVGRKQLAGA
jgi:hypothetical protein